MTKLMARLPATCLALLCLCPLQGQAQQTETLEDILTRVPTAPPGLSLQPLPETPRIYETGEGFSIAVSVIAEGLDHPWSMVALPDGTLLVTERSGQMRMIQGGQLLAEPVPGLPDVAAFSYSGLHDVILHPEFDDNALLYLTYNKPLPDDKVAVAVLRARWDGSALIEAEDIFVADAGISGASRIMFDDAGKLYLSLYASGPEAQDLATINGKILRLNEDGSVPQDNPFVDQDGARPEIFTLGHRTTQGLAQHPQSGDIYQLEMGPNGGDEVNILAPGANYGWPDVSLGRDYAGAWQGEFVKQGVVNPDVYWMPSISVSGMLFYTGDKIPAWQGDLFVSGLRTGEIPGTGQLNRIRFNAVGQEIRREILLSDLHYRIRGVHQGVDGYLYVLTDEDNGAVLKIGPAE